MAVIKSKIDRRGNRSPRGAPAKIHYVYILECGDGTLYTGITNDLDRRLKSHNEGRASKYTRRKLPVRCVYTERQADLGAAKRREWQIKSWSRARKMGLINFL